MLDKDRKTFYSYDSSWEHTFFDERTGGFLVTQLARKYKPMSKKDMETFLKEQRMGIKYAEHTIKDQGADFVLIEFSALDSKIPARIKEMVRIGIHGYFYCDDEKGFHSF